MDSGRFILLAPALEVLCGSLGGGLLRYSLCDGTKEHLVGWSHKRHAWNKVLDVRLGLLTLLLSPRFCSRARSLSLCNALDSPTLCGSLFIERKVLHLGLLLERLLQSGSGE
jgi:hypothetical protein